MEHNNQTIVQTIIPQSDERFRLSHSTNIGCKIDDQSWLHLFLRLPRLEMILPQRYYPLQSIENRKLIEEVFKIYINCHEEKTPTTKKNGKNDLSEAMAVMSFIGTPDWEENSIFQMTSSNYSLKCFDSPTAYL